MVVLLGDSITEFGSNDGGWHQQLTRDYARKVGRLRRPQCQCQCRRGLGNKAVARVGGSTAASSWLTDQA